ncbi:hypothetical protein [Streptomyces himalayensis]|uniref:hypothetical protein n=1 Tax=Streptomyces himalayensis TaxID=2820085 RepID=UPI001FE72653|nr:hypothetical protein [Streptomyces himalayensis]
MAKTGPQRYPGASTAYWYQDNYGGNAMESNVIAWHSTEGTSLPSYGGGSSAPNFTAKPDFGAKRLVWFQHFDFDTSSRALRNLAGGVQTNTLNVCQVEIVGTCDPTTHTKWTQAGYPHLYTPELPDWAIRDLAAFAKWAHDNHGVPLTSGLTFKAYPSSYGANGVRMTGSQWTSFKGHCGHQHVPENDHGDPGAFPMAAILTAAKGGSEPQEDDMPTTDEIATAVLKKDNIVRNAVGTPDNEFVTPATVLYRTEVVVRRIEAKLTAQDATISELTKAVAALAADSTAIDADALVARITAAIENVTVRLDVADA